MTKQRFTIEEVLKAMREFFAPGALGDNANFFIGSLESVVIKHLKDLPEPEKPKEFERKVWAYKDKYTRKKGLDALYVDGDGLIEMFSFPCRKEQATPITVTYRERHDEKK